MSKIAVIGFGEVGSVFARDLVDKGATAAAFDTAPAAQAQAEAANIAVPSAIAAAHEACAMSVCVTPARCLMPCARSLVVLAMCRSWLM